MDFKTVGKSKSSNAAVSLKEKRQNRKSTSNATIQPAVVKKRGVYVEKKVQSSTDAKEAGGIQPKKKPPPRPRPGQKKFLSSVLTILSKSTAATQYPENIRTNERNRIKPRWKFTNDDESKPEHKINKTKKTKYRSRVLNAEMLRAEQEKFIVLQPKKEIAQTPSNYSSRSKNASDSVKWSEVSQKDNEPPKISAIRDVLENTIYSGVAEGITKEVLEGRTKKEKKLRINDDPVTLASEIVQRDDKKLYNFFVDLLETTISVYNVKAEYEISDTSKTVLEINDSVAKKLEFKFDSQDNVNCELTCNRIDKTENDVHENENIPIDIKLSEYKPPAHVIQKQKIKAQSFMCPNIRKPNLRKSYSFDNNKKSKRKPKKKDLMNILKEQLKMDTFSFEEPQSLYQALKVMARNKRRYEKSIHFAKKPHKTIHDYDTECMFQRRKVISFGSKKKNNITKNVEQAPDLKCYVQKYDEENGPKKYFPSYHSLEVYGYDYEDPGKLREVTDGKRVIFTYHSSPSTSDSNVGDYKGLIRDPVSSASSKCSVYRCKL